MSHAYSLRDIAAAVKGRRRDLGFSQARLAKEAGVSRKWISEFESGKPTAELQLVLRVLDALGMRVRLEPAERDVHVTGDFDLDEVLKAFEADRRAQGRG